MTPKHPPRIATWLLKHFGFGPNIDAVLGDLDEQYLKNGSAIWYWRQAIKAIPATFFREIQRYRIPVAGVFGVTFLALILIAALLSDIDPFWKLGLGAALGGVFFGVLLFWRGYKEEKIVSSNPIGDVRIDSSKIPIRGGIGAGLVIVILLSGMLVEIPELRLVAALAILAGMVFGGLLFLWRRHQA